MGTDSREKVRQIKKVAIFQCVFENVTLYLINFVIGFTYQPSYFLNDSFLLNNYIVLHVYAKSLHLLSIRSKTHKNSIILGPVSNRTGVQEHS